MVRPGILQDRQGVHVGAQPYRWARRGSFDDRDAPRLCDAGVDLSDAELAQAVGDEFRRLVA